MVNIFLLFLAQTDKGLPYLSSIAPSQNEIGYDSNLYVNFDFKFSPELNNAVLDWISDTVFRLTEAMLENDEEKYYQRTASIIKALNGLLLRYDIEYMESSALDYYNKEYINKPKFLKILNSIE
jgi:hypothetical protein